MVTYKIILEFDIIFPDEDYKEYLGKLIEIPKKYIYDFSSTFLRYRIQDEQVSNLQKLLSIWFRKENESYANDLIKRIRAAESKNKNQYIIINEVTNLLIFEAGFENEVIELKICEPELEILFFKIYLAFNQKSTEHEKLAGSSTNHLVFPQKLNALLLSQTIVNSDITEYNINES